MPGWTVTSHILPAAWPRAPTPLAPMDDADVELKSRGQRASHFMQLAKELQRRRNAWDEHALAFDTLADDMLWIVANRYSRERSSPGGVTVVAVHAAGMHKEVRDRKKRTSSVTNSRNSRGNQHYAEFSRGIARASSMRSGRSTSSRMATARSSIKASCPRSVSTFHTHSGAGAAVADRERLGGQRTQPSSPAICSRSCFTTCRRRL